MDITMYSKDDGVALLERKIYNKENQEADFCLAVRSSEGKECQSTPISKWCGYAEHLTDIRKSSSGYE